MKITLNGTKHTISDDSTHVAVINFEENQR